MSQDPWQNPNDQQQGGYPTPPPAYPSYPGGAYGYNAPAPVKPPMPQSVRIAVTMMFAGAAVEVVNLIIGLSLSNTVEQHLHDLGYSTTTIDGDKSRYFASVVIGGLIRVGLWLWMALAVRAGHNYARIVSSVFFGIGVLGSLVNLAAGWVPVIDKIGSVATLLVGLLAIIFAWKGESGPYFNPSPGPAYGYGAPYPPQGQQPPYGQG